MPVNRPYDGRYETGFEVRKSRAFLVAAHASERLRITRPGKGARQRAGVVAPSDVKSDAYPRLRLF